MKNERIKPDSYSPEKDFLVLIDSEGTVFDTLEVKQKECFCPNFIRFFELQAVSRFARETWEFVNLYSVYRGLDRFSALQKSLELLSQRPELAERSFHIESYSALEEWLNKAKDYTNSSLGEYANRLNDPYIDRVYAWSLQTNHDIFSTVYKIPPLPPVESSLEKISQFADIVVISDAITENTLRVWTKYGLTSFVRLITGAEDGPGHELIKTIIRHYRKKNVLLIADDPQHLKLARSEKISFYPIDPYNEIQSWNTLYDTEFTRFCEGRFTKKREHELELSFLSGLPASPGWE